jgi:hypothetical protein
VKEWGVETRKEKERSRLKEGEATEGKREAKEGKRPREEKKEVRAELTTLHSE